MKNFVWGFVAGALLGFCAQADAADLRTPYKAPELVAPAYSWSGPWLGVFIGGGVNSTKPQIDLGGQTADIGTMPRGVLGGVEIGYDFQFAPQWVFGLFAEGSLASINDSGNIAGVIANNMATNYMLGVGGRLGFLITPTTMIYGKAGFAGVGEKPNWQVATLQQAAADTSAGWVAGGGIEHKLSFAPNWSVKLEYDHWQAGDKTFTFTDSSGLVTTANNKISIDAVRAGLTLHF